MTAAVDVVMTAWNAERFIGDALRSALEQTTPPSRIIVVDDGSTDATRDIASRMHPTIEVVARAHEGIGRARNAGIAATDAPLIALMDADDLWFPTKLERQLALARTDPSVEATFCLIDEFHDLSGSPAARVRAPRTNVRVPLPSAALLDRRLVERVGLFIARPVGEWVDWWARARAAGVVEHFVDEVLVRRRIHGANNSLRSDDDHTTLLGVARRHLRATRQSG